jgi:WD40 repeat protein
MRNVPLCKFAGIVAISLLMLALTDRARAVGWGPTDFLVGGGPGGSRIGVFDSTLIFKGFLTTSTQAVGGMEFDAAGRLVTVRTFPGTSGEVRVYDSSGVQVGGFVRSNTLLGSPGDLTVAPNGDYIVATQNYEGGSGARQFAPDGTFVRQLGTGWITGATVVPGNRLWTGGPDFSAINVFDLSTGMQIDSLVIPEVHGVMK